MALRDSAREVFDHAVRIGPYKGGVRVAVRSAVCLGVPLIVLLLVGRLDLGMYASFAAFTSVYGRHDRYGERLWMQASAGVMLVSAMLLGTWMSYLDAPAPMRVLGVAVIASVVTWVAAVMKWHPPGGLFSAFASGTTAALPATLVSFSHVIVVGGCTVLFSLLVTAGLGVVRGRWRDLRGPAPRPTPNPQAVPVALTILVGSTLAGCAGLVVAAGHWYWAMVASVAALSGAYVTARVARGLQRLVGTLVGVLLAAGVMALGLPHWALVILAMVFQGIVEILMDHNYALAMLFATTIALIMVQMAVAADPAALVRDRVLDTFVGVTVGTVVAVASAALRRRMPQPDEA
ncbi:FUSC family protein [Tessaracoccus palaemonis]|uniref:FUSC family protein n=1 Tax=Tessaracoccus palaemonis TaxID=2829499 RepID=A0ABX8SPA7_9ACTN|nr:FUSC family protein [Tessaracoccus palaemonis]QXT63928.1 FUSC family protein [Tessaracoccus palaemonis]